MIKEGKFGSFEAICLTSIFILSKLFYTNMGTLVKMTGTAAWLSSVFACTTAIFFFYMIYSLLKRFPGKNLFEIMDLVIGRFLSIIIGITISLYFFYYSASTLREFVEMLKTYTLPYTPISIIILCILAVAVILTSYGLETIVRVSTMFFVPIIFGIVIILLLAAPSYDSTLLRPALGHGFLYTAQKGFLRSSGYTEIFSLCIIAPALHNMKELKRTGIVSILLAGTVFVIGHACYVMSFGYPVASEKIAGFFEMTRGIYFNRFFQRIESIFIFLWVSASVITVSISFYIAVTSYGKTLKISNYKPLIPPSVFIVFMVAMMSNNLAEVIEINMKILRNYSILFFFSLSILLLLVAIIFRKGGTEKNEKGS